MSSHSRLFNFCCNLCGSESSKILYTIATQKVTRSFIQCKECGLIQAVSLPPAKELKDWYSFSHPKRYAKFLNPLDPHTRNNLLRRAKIHLKLINSWYRTEIKNDSNYNRRLLDVGCGRGYFCNLAKKFGWDITGVELSPVYAECAKKSHAKIFVGTLKEANFPDEYFDIVVASHILEHLRDPFEECLELNRVLHPQGRLLIGLPNIESFWSKVYGPRWIWINAEEHLYHFPQYTLNRMLRKAGFDLVWIKTYAEHDASLFPNRYNSKDDINFLEIEYAPSIVTPEKYQTRGNLNKAWVYIKHREFTPLIKKIVHKIAREAGMHLLSPIINGILARFRMGDELVVLAKKRIL